MPVILWISSLFAPYVWEHMAAFSVGCTRWLVVVSAIDSRCIALESWWTLEDVVTEAWFSSASTSEDTVELQTAWSGSNCQKVAVAFAVLISVRAWSQHPR